MKTNLRSWTSWLGQTPITLVLTLLVFFTFLHGCICWLLEAQCNARLARITANSQTRQVPQSLKDYQHKLGSPTMNGAPLYQAAWELVDQKGKSALEARLEKSISGRSHFVLETPTDVQAVGEFLQSQSEVFEFVGRADRKPECSYQIRYERGFHAVAPNFIKARGLAKLLSMRGSWAKARGDWSLWNQNFQEGLRFAQRFEPDNSVIGQLIRIALISIVLDTSHEVPVDKVSAESKEQARLMAEDLPRRWDLTMQGEYLQAIQYFEELECGNESYNPLIHSLSSAQGEIAPPKGAELVRLLYSAGGRPLILADKLYYLSCAEGMTQPLKSVRSVEVTVPGTVSWALFCNPERVARQFRISDERLRKVAE